MIQYAIIEYVLNIKMFKEIYYLEQGFNSLLQVRSV